MIKALPLITITPPSEHCESPSISINSATFLQLTAHFAKVRAFYPILVFGSYGKSSLLTSIMRLAGRASGEESGFECGDNDPDGVYVCPQPLQLGSTTILLMKMRGSPRLDESADVRRRVRACVVPLSLFCLMKEEMTKSLEEIQIFAQDYYLLREKLGLETAKLLVCAENSGWYTKNPCKLPFIDLKNKHGRLFEVRYPKSAGLWLEPNDLLDESLKAPYTRTHADLSSDNPYCIHQFLTILSLFVRTADMSPTFSAFLGNAPNPRDPAAEQQLERVNLAVISAKRIQNSAEALDFLVKQESAVGYAFDQRTLETIQRNYMLTEPTVVLVVMGAPGLGKSTLLNHIIQHCIESPRCTNLFTTGNTGNHTTRGSQVLSHPLYYKRHQMMIVDLEGLGGTETLDRAKGVLQANLVSALLAVASVPCILVKNEAVSLEFAKRTITQLAKLQETFGFKIERIYLLFHDLNPGAPLNIDFEGFRVGVNSKFFHGEVVKMLNKPNFKEANGDENRRLFLDSFINECLYFKKNVSDSFVNISELITYIGVIAKHQNTHLNQLTLNMSEVKEYDRFVGFLHTKLKEIIGNLKPPNSVPLLSFFNEQIRLVLDPQVNAKFASMGSGLQAHCKFRADLDIEAAKAPFTEIEAYYNFIRVVPEVQMVENIKQIVDGYHKAAWSIVAFMPRLELLETRLRQVQYHISESQVKMTAILRALESKKRSCFAWTAVGYTMQTALAMVTFGTSTVVTAGGSIAYSLAAAERGVNMGLETTNLETLGAALGQSAGPTWAAGICTNLIFPKRATELIWINSAWGNGQINEEVLGPLRRRLRSKTPIVLIIGSKATITSDFANCFMRYISPFTLEEFAAFHPSKYTQTLIFDYFNPGICETALPGCVICLRMKKKPSSTHSQTMLKIAEVLMPIASVACLLVNRCNSYAHALLNTLCPQRAPDDSQKAAVMPTKVVVISSNREAVEDLQSALARGYVAHDVRQVTSFSKNALALAVGTIKDALDNSEPQTATLVMEKITSLPSCLQAMSRR